jgi:thiamine-phosphate pyrophosphorylase
MTTTHIESLRETLKVYFIMGSTNCLKNPAEVLKEAIFGGITLFQYREKGEGALTGDAKYKLAQELQSICKVHHIPFIVNDDIELALAINADGVHIGQEDEPVKKVRERIGDKILGVSVHSMDEAISAVEDGADYFGVGPVFLTTTKKDVKPSQGTRLIEKLRNEGFTIPIVGIGGITAENASSVIRAGADGVSVITAISHAESPTVSARALKENIRGDV